MAAVLSADALLVEVFALMVVVHLLTRRRTVPGLRALKRSSADSKSVVRTTLMSSDSSKRSTTAGGTSRST